MFNLENQVAKLNNVNVRAEKHGQENKMAADLKFTMAVSNDVLSEFDPMLKGSFYKKGDEAQGELIDDPGHLTALKFPKLGSIAWDQELHNYDFTLHIGIDSKSNVILQDCIVDKFKFTPKDGGTVEIAFRVISHPESAQLGRLCEYIQDNVTISLVQSEVVQQDLPQE